MNLRVLLVLTIMATIVSCSKATSKPQYKYKKNAGDGIAAKIGDITITDKEVMNGIEADIFDAEYKVFQIKFAKLNQLIVEKLIVKDPSSKGLTNDQYFEKHIYKNIKVSDKEFNEFVKSKNIPKEQINPQVSEKIRNYLSMQKKEGILNNWIAEQTKKTGIEVYIEKPQRPTFDVPTEGAPFTGGKDAKVTIVEFSDFQCPYCAEGSKVLKKLKKKYGKNLKVVMKQFPLPFHSQAKKASLGALCANEQNMSKFWEMHDRLFADQSKLGVKDLKALAGSLGLDSAKFDKCLDENKYMAQVEKDIQDGKSLGVKSTPTFFVNGQLVAGALPVEEFSELIDQELAK